MNELDKILFQIQDLLVPKLDSYEQAIYHYIFRHTYLLDKKQMLFSTWKAEIGYSIGSNTKPPSSKTRSNKLRTLERKGALKIVERSNKGIIVEIILPSEMNGLVEEAKNIELNMAALDFYKDRRLLPALLERENYRCFYTGRKITEENCYLDHVVPQSKGGNNNFSNIVVTCYDANSMKQDMAVDDFARSLFKEDMLSLKEFKELKKRIEDLQNGILIPSEQTVSSVIKS